MILEIEKKIIGNAFPRIETFKTSKLLALSDVLWVEVQAWGSIPCL